MNILYRTLQNYIFEKYDYLRNTRQYNELGIEREKLTTQPFYGFAIMLDGLIIQYTIAETKNAAIDKKTASWWLENPKAKVVELELVEKQHG
jgi:hypothetical protein